MLLSGLLAVVTLAVLVGLVAHVIRVSPES